MNEKTRWLPCALVVLLLFMAVNVFADGTITESPATPTDLEVAEESVQEEPPQEELPQEEPTWSLSIPSGQSIAYKAERTKIGTISVKNASNFTDGQFIRVTLDYSSFTSGDHSIPIVITVIQNGVERTWSAGTSFSLKPDGSDPITVYVNISAEAWSAAPHGSYAMSLRFRSGLSGSAGR